jgi:hypothetical protein
MIRHSTCRFAKIANAIMKKDQSQRSRKVKKPLIDVGGTGAIGNDLTGPIK